MQTYPTSSRLHSVLVGLSTVLLLGLVVVAQGTDLRRFSAALGVAAFALLTWRAVSTWTILTPLERYLAGGLATAPLLSAIAQQSLVAATDGQLPDNPWLWALIAHRAGCILVVVFWSHLLGRRLQRQQRRASLAPVPDVRVPWAA